jgi:hypothetical protein
MTQITENKGRRRSLPVTVSGGLKLGAKGWKGKIKSRRGALPSVRVKGPRRYIRIF